MLSKNYPVQTLCSIIGLARSSYYYANIEADDAEVVRAIEEVAARFPTYGSRRITHQLRRAPYHLTLNRKRVVRLMQEHGLVCRRTKATKRTTNSRHPFARFANLVADLEVTRPDQVWVSDITYIRLGSGEFVYLAIIMDVFTRRLRGWSLSRGMGVELTLAALHQALRVATPHIHHSDQGVQYAATEYVAVLHAAEVQISMAEVGCAEQNGYAERVIRTIKEEEVALGEYHSFEDARAQIGNFITDVYNHKRIHSSLGYLTPAEYEAQWQQQQLAAKQQSG
jgi:transposase InsO family protein